MAQEEEPQLPTEQPQSRAAAPPVIVEEKEEEGEIFSLKDLITRRGKGGQPTTLNDILPYVILSDMMDRREDRREERRWRNEQRTKAADAPRNTASPEIVRVESQITSLSQTVDGLVKMMGEKEQKAEQVAFVQGVVKETADKILPEITAVSQRLQALEQRAATAPSSSEDVSELKSIRGSLQGIVDKIGETAGAKGMNITDLENIMSVIEKLEKHFDKGSEGEVSPTTMAISTFGEIGKELVSAYKEISAQKVERGEAGSQHASAPAAPATAIQAIIKRQVQDYVVQRMQAGSTKIDVNQAAADLGISAEQVVWAYNQLAKEGWFQIQGQKTKGKEEEKPEPRGQERQPEEAVAAAEASDQIFRAPKA